MTLRWCVFAGVGDGAVRGGSGAGGAARTAYSVHVARQRGTHYAVTARDVARTRRRCPGCTLLLRAGWDEGMSGFFERVKRGL